MNLQSVHDQLNLIAKKDQIALIILNVVMDFAILELILDTVFHHPAQGNYLHFSYTFVNLHNFTFLQILICYRYCECSLPEICTDKSKCTNDRHCGKNGHCDWGWYVNTEG